MHHYTLDASGLIRYFVDLLPAGAEAAFQSAVAGEAVLSLPAIAAAEAMYVARNRDDIAGRPFSGTPSDVIAVVESDGPIDLDAVDLDLIREVPNWHTDFSRQLHDAMVVSSHVVRETDAIITSDDRIAGVVPTVWD